MPSFDITTQRTSARWASVSVDNVYGQAGLGFFRLCFQLRLHVAPAEPEEAETLTELAAEVRAGPNLLGMLTPQPQMLPVRQMNYPHDWPLVITMDVDRGRLEAIEAYRAGKDLQLALHVYSCTVMADGPGG